MNDEDKVIDAIRQDYVTNMMVFSPGIETLLRSVYRAGYKQREIEEMEKQLKSLTGDDNGTTTMV